MSVVVVERESVETLNMGEPAPPYEVRRLAFKSRVGVKDFGTDASTAAGASPDDGALVVPELSIYAHTLCQLFKTIMFRKYP